ncbi:von Willebrand factor A [Steroidobacter denitrificans]|uniref:von Willebrand factor A n=1 Tax=Steroidobacter denitrificans TaxID=465721 RepID=A0A127F938_STEDE|nr:VWA domain-containing protein [Steroidobacter denitrificans]AMN46118.1 von Willebrand factor A [Steroidobacter denitrificans]
MLVPFFFKLREIGVPVSITELLTLLEGLKARIIEPNAEEFYFLSRACLVKDERHFDRFDRAFGAYFKGVEDAFEDLLANIPEEWLRRASERILSEEDKAQIEALGGWDKLMETLQQRLAEQKERHQGGNKWIGTAGTSPFGAYGYNPEGIRIGQQESRHRRAVKVWDQRDFQNLDDSVELGTRNIKVALRKLRRFAREGAAEHLDLDDTISSTARNAGMLDLKFVPERHNAVKVLLFLDVGGSMDDHVRICEELFSAARSEFKHLEYFYFHNFIYESVWKDNRRRHVEKIPTLEVMRTYGHDYKLIFVGDAAMSPYEIIQPGGSIEHWNEETGAVWMQRLARTWPQHVWLNPKPQPRWEQIPSVQITRELIEDRMFPLTLAGLERAIKALH